jgi:fructokinase
MIVSCGEALIDFMPRKGADGARCFQPFAGGSPFNTAIALGRLGVPAGFFGGLSRDFFGEMLRRALVESGVDLGLVHNGERPTTLAFVSLENGDARYAFFDEGSVGRTITENDLPPLPREVTALHFASFSLAEEPCGSALEALMQRERNARVLCIDPNIRPTLVKNREAHLARLDRLFAMSDIVKLSGEDLAWLDPSATPEAFAEKWLARGVKLVVFTRGADGAAGYVSGARVAIPAIAVKVADTIGAGDTFTAAILVRLEHRGLLDKEALATLGEAELSDLLAFAAKAASITVSRPGADPPWAREMA